MKNIFKLFVLLLTAISTMLVAKVGDSCKINVYDGQNVSTISGVTNTDDDCIVNCADGSHNDGDLCQFVDAYKGTSLKRISMGVCSQNKCVSECENDDKDQPKGKGINCHVNADYVDTSSDVTCKSYTVNKKSFFEITCKNKNNIIGIGISKNKFEEESNIFNSF